MNKPVFLLLPVVALWVLVALAPIPHLPGLGDSDGLAQIVDTGPAACLPRCQEEVARIGQDCLNAGRSSDECGPLARSHYEICQRACTNLSVHPVQPTTTNTTQTTQPTEPVRPAAEVLTCEQCSARAEETYVSCRQAGQTETICTDRGNRMYSDCQKVACVGISGKRVPNMPGCRSECINLGQTYQSQCLSAGRSSAFCEKLRGAFVNQCNVFMCGQQSELAANTAPVPFPTCFSSCGGPNREYMDKLCLDSGETTVRCDYGNDYLVVQCLKTSCANKSLGGIPDEPKASTPSTSAPTSPSTNPTDNPCLACHNQGEAQVRACLEAGRSSEECEGIRRRQIDQCLVACGRNQAATQQALQEQIATLTNETNNQPEPATTVSQPITGNSVTPINNLAGGGSQTQGGQVSSPAGSSDQPSALLTVWNTVTNFFAGLIGREEKRVLPDACSNVPTQVAVGSSVTSGVVRGEYYRGTCSEAVVKANSSCQANIQIALDAKVKAICQSLCKNTTGKTCTPSPLLTNLVTQGCDLDQATRPGGIPGESKSGVWVPGGEGAAGGTNGFCHARSTARRITADLDCRCGGSTGVVGPVTVTAGSDIPGFTQDAKTGQEIPTSATYFIVEVWTAENCSDCRAYSNVEVGPDGKAYYLEANRPITGASPVEAELSRAYKVREIKSKEFRVTHYHGDSKGLYPDPKGDGTKMAKIWGKIPRVKITKFVNGKEDTTTGIFYPADRGGISSISKAFSDLE